MKIIKLALAAVALLSTQASVQAQTCIPNREESVPDLDEDPSNGNLPWAYGTGAEECSCLSYQYMVAATSPDCSHGCDYTVTWTFKDCDTLDESLPCYRADLPGQPWVRLSGAPACCGPATIPATDPDRYNQYWEITQQDHALDGVSMETVQCGKEDTAQIIFTCPGFQIGNNATIGCDNVPNSLIRWGGTVLRIAADCVDC